MIAWSKHPIAAIQHEIDDFNASTNKEWRDKRFDVYRNRAKNLLLCEKYATELLNAKYIDFEEYAALALFPYSGTLSARTYDKTSFEMHKLLFLCSERELYPIILRQIVRYMAYLYIEAGYRRELLLDVVHLASKHQRSEIYRMAKEGYMLRDIIDKFNLHTIYQQDSNKALAYYYCTLSKRVSKQI